eukprot:1027824-Rhodomonas_salina.1
MELFKLGSARTFTVFAVLTIHLPPPQKKGKKESHHTSLLFSSSHHHTPTPLPPKRLNRLPQTNKQTKKQKGKPPRTRRIPLVDRVARREQNSRDRASRVRRPRIRPARLRRVGSGARAGAGARAAPALETPRAALLEAARGRGVGRGGPRRCAGCVVCALGGWAVASVGSVRAVGAGGLLALDLLAPGLAPRWCGGRWDWTPHL